MAAGGKTVQKEMETAAWDVKVNVDVIELCRGLGTIASFGDFAFGRLRAEKLRRL